jgi:glutathione peroxidase
MADIREIPVTTIDGRDTTLAEHDGKVLLVVNVASACGLTPQYEGLQALYAAKQPDGLEILGFPANDFAGQEPGTNEEIAEFCSTSYSVTFPMYSKIPVTGEGKHPLYAALTEAAPEAAGDPDAFRSILNDAGIDATEAPEVLWNFEKFLVSRDGTVVGRFAPAVAPDAPELVAAIEAELSR